MRPRVLAVLALVALLLVVPTAAQAKGASAATVDGGGPGGLPGGPITLGGDGEPGSGTTLGNLTDASGLFTLMFERRRTATRPCGQCPGGLQAAPTDRLGPRYTITWTFPDDRGNNGGIRQYVYPYAVTGPVTFMPAGQPIFGEATIGGWYQASDSLRQQLISLGLPDRTALGSAASPAPAPAGAQPAPAAAPPPAWPRVAAVGAGLLLVARAALVQRRPHPTTTARCTDPARQQTTYALDQAGLVAVRVLELRPPAQGPRCGTRNDCSMVPPEIPRGRQRVGRGSPDMHRWRREVADGLAVQEERAEGPVPVQLLQARHGHQRRYPERAGDPERHGPAAADLHHPRHRPVLAEGLLARPAAETSGTGLTAPTAVAGLLVLAAADVRGGGLLQALLDSRPYINWGGLYLHIGHSN
jgi:hypothetical protein